MNKNTIYIVGAVLVIIAFFGGMMYGKTSCLSAASADRQSRMAAIGGAYGGRGGTRGGNTGGGFLSGQILSKDSNSLTIKLRDGGSKIVFLSASTTVQKQTEGSVGDLNVGTEVTAMGSPNTDGSVNAQSIQIR
jgi:hypothetical protein